MIDIFEPVSLDLNNITCHSGGAEGSDFFFLNLLVNHMVLKPMLILIRPSIILPLIR